MKEDQEGTSGDRHSLICPDCGKGFPHAPMLARHMTETHGVDEKDANASVRKVVAMAKKKTGKKKSSKKKTAKKKAAGKVDKRKQKMKCPECGKICKGPGPLGKHRSSAHGVKPTGKPRASAASGNGRRRGRPPGRPPASAGRRAVGGNRPLSNMTLEELSTMVEDAMREIKDRLTMLR